MEGRERIRRDISLEGSLCWTLQNFVRIFNECSVLKHIHQPSSSYFGRFDGLSVGLSKFNIMIINFSAL